MLTPLADSTRPLSDAAASPAQISFSPNGRLLVVTEKATNRLATYTVDRDGRASGPMAYASAGMTPFGFAFTSRGYLIVSEAFGGAVDASAVSSYRLMGSTPQAVSRSVSETSYPRCLARS